ncbi:MAG TPA: ATP-binding protein [Thermoanaerobaculia bacterium]|jgi:signal transduction histidine kinase|nr:ATP-binding protein [Thermoanaerobaculia bacterium]
MSNASAPRRAPLLGVSSMLLALFAAGVVVLSSTIPALWVVAQRSERERETAISDACAAAIAVQSAAGHPISAATLDGLRQRYRIEAIELESGDLILSGTIPMAGAASHTETRVVSGNALRIHFAESALQHIARTVRLAMIAGFVAGIAAILLLPIYVKDAIRGRAPAEAGTQGNEGGTSYLLHTFGSSLETLKQRENELKRLHQQEKERADELARLTGTLVRSLSSGFIALDEAGRIVEINQVACDVLNLPGSGAVTGRRVEEALGTSSFAHTLALAHEHRLAVQRREVTSGGAEATHIGVSTVPLLDQEGRYLGMLALFADLTDVRKLEQRVRDMQALADLGEMSGGIAHEFRNSLAAILGYLRLARRGATDESSNERLRKAEQEALALSDAVERLLALGRPMTARHEPVELSALARDVVARIAPLAPSIAFAITGDEVSIGGDAALLSRALDNIVRNAVESIQARGGEGHVAIATTAHPRRRITIEDDGAGLDPAVRLFVPFQSGKPAGFGLGLTLTKKIILLHHGTIQLIARAEGGAVAEIEFDDVPREELVPGEIAPERLPGRYIL